MNDLVLVKKRPYSKEIMERILQRVAKTQNLRPLDTVVFKKIVIEKKDPGFLISTTQKRFPLKNLQELLKNKSLSESDLPWLLQNLVLLQSSWRRSGFVHGDLSLRNLLVNLAHQHFLAVDWLLDLDNKEGTPLFCHPKVSSGIHDHSTDHFSFLAIKEFLLKRLVPGYDQNHGRNFFF